MRGVTSADTFHVRIQITEHEIEAYARWGFVRNGQFCKQPAGIEIIWMPREDPSSNEVNSIWFCTPYNPDPDCRKTGEDIEAELAKLAVVDDSVQGHGMIRHPWIKIQTLELNPQLDYNKGELDFLRSKPVNPTVARLTEQEVLQANQMFERQQKKQGIVNPKTLKKGKPFKDKWTGMTFYEYNLIQITEGGGEEEHADPEAAKITSRQVPPHMQIVKFGREWTKRWWENERSEETAVVGGNYSSDPQ